MRSAGGGLHGETVLSARYLTNCHYTHERARCTSKSRFPLRPKGLGSRGALTGRTGVSPVPWTVHVRPMQRTRRPLSQLVPPPRWRRINWENGRLVRSMDGPCAAHATGGTPVVPVGGAGSAGRLAPPPSTKHQALGTKHQPPPSGNATLPRDGEGFFLILCLAVPSSSERTEETKENNRWISPSYSTRLARR